MPKPVTPASLAKAWFKNNPRNYVSAHWRWNELPQSSREAMSAPRTCRVSGNTVLFDPHRSELSLVGLQGAEYLDNGALRLTLSPGREIEYFPAVKG